ncbi:DUF6130 family protein [Nocardia macrotermitis]|uniref:Lipoprotein n=1 Tax=Nocardia macrotermitis TaxID=2585198 RepID=A0A7K0DAT6_9NOCA|nr:DUF6130 family protein [Nocardia macrotermitis]MQY22631.1 hypothetical protein [Nocardia macrotermitis]
MSARHSLVGVLGGAAAALLLASAACSSSTPEPVAPVTVVPVSGEPTWSPAPVIPLTAQSAPALVVDQPLPDQLAMGLVVIRYRAENMRVVAAYGAGALSVSPRIGHIHVVVDDAPWHWADASGEPLIIQSLPAGPHKVWIGLAAPTHRVLDSKTVSFAVPAHSDHH